MNSIGYSLTSLNEFDTFNVSFPTAGRVFGKGGPDITRALNRTLLEVEMKYYSWSPRERRSAAEEMLNYFAAAVTGGDGGAATAWDIIPLYNLGLASKNEAVNALEGANHKIFKCGSGQWRGTVAVNGRVYWAGSVNYALWGKMHRLVYDDLKDRAPIAALDYSLEKAKSRAVTWKHVRYNDYSDRVTQAEAFVSFGFNGTLSHVSLPCEVSGIFDGRDFEWCWEPNWPRKGSR